MGSSTSFPLHGSEPPRGSPFLILSAVSPACVRDMSLDFFSSCGLPSSRGFIEFVEGQRGEPVYVANNRLAGRFVHHPGLGRVFVTFRDSRRHVYRKWGSIGISREAVVKARASGTRYIAIVLDGAQVLLATPELYLEKGRPLWFGEEKDPQLHVPISMMQRLPP